MDDFGKQVALLAHAKAIAEIAEIQQRIALRLALHKQYGERALPVREAFRTSIPLRQQVLSNALELMGREWQADTERLDKLYAIVERLEMAFADFHGRSDAQWEEMWGNLHRA